MSLGIVFKGPEGIVLAADSRVILTTQLPDQPPIYSSYDNATKLLQVAGHKHVGAVTYGVGAIGGAAPRTAHSYIPEFEEELARADVKRFTVAQFADQLSDFFMRQWTSQMPADYQGPDMVFLVGGYDAGEAYGRAFEFHIPSSPTLKEWHGGPGGFGIIWGGQREFADRLITGFDGRLPAMLQAFLGLSEEQRDDVQRHLREQLQAPIPFAFLPLQDCVDVAIFLIRTTMMIQNWVVGVRGVGGGIDVATITRTDGFQPVQQKAIIGERPPRGGIQ